MRDYNKRVEELFSEYNPESSSFKIAKTYLKITKELSDLYYGMKSMGISPTNGKEIYLRRNGDVTDVWSADEWTLLAIQLPRDKAHSVIPCLYNSYPCLLLSSILWWRCLQQYPRSYVENATLKMTM